jgi:signal transduction histidine kinase
MTPSIFSRGADITRRVFSDLTDFLGRLSLGRMLILCLLMLIAANLAKGLFSSSPPSKHRSVVQINKPKVPETPEPAPLPSPPTDSPEAKDPPSMPITVDVKGAPESDQRLEIRIGNRNIVVRGPNDLKDLDKKIEEQIDREVSAELEQIAEDEPARSGISLPGLAMLLIVLMFIMRLIAKSKVRAEERARTAETTADSEALSRQLAEAKLQAMQAQVEPHFLFNTLAAVEHLIETDPPRAAGMQRNLIAYLRSVLPNLRQSDSTLGREAEISRNYLEILKVRMESRLEFHIDIPAGLASAAMPPLMLQSLVENAIEHGLEPKPAGGTIGITATVHHGQLVVTVADTGAGFSPASQLTTPAQSDRGVGLGSIRERLKALFDGQGRLIIEANQPSGTRAILEFPYVVKPSTPRPDRG